MNRANVFYKAILGYFCILSLLLTACTATETPTPIPTTTRAFVFPIGEQEYSMLGADAVQIDTGDSCWNMSVDTTIIFEIAPESRDLVNQSWETVEQYTENLIRPAVRSAVRNVFSEPSPASELEEAESTATVDAEEALAALEAWGEEIETQLEEEVRTQIEPYGFRLISISFMINFEPAGDICFSSSNNQNLIYNEVQSLENAQQTATQATINLRNAEATATASMP